MNKKNINNKFNGGSEDIEAVSIHSSEIRPVDENDMKCAPTKKFEHGSCIPLNVLVDMAKAYNEDNPTNQIKLSATHETVNPIKYKRYLIKQFKNKLTKCPNQQCWTKQPFMKRLNEKVQEDLKKETFRPKGPEGKFTWLNTNNIDQVMAQYEAKYPDYEFLGAVPIDFDELPAYGIKNLNFKKLMEKGKTKLGIIFNTDPHYKSGQHWIAMYTDLNKGNCYFFDSYGLPPEKEVQRLMKRIGKFIKDNGSEPVMDHNRMQHQRKSVDCGTYSIAFILRMLRGDNFENINSVRVPDDEINECRDVYFAH
jgi:hypothetical protein